MKHYYVNVHYDMVVSVEVDAENEQDAINEATIKAGQALPDEMECVGTNACITDVEEDTNNNKA